MTERIAVLILAAGKGTRMQHPELPKVMVEYQGRPMIAHLIDAIVASGVCAKPTLVVGYRQEKIRECFGNEVEYVEQSEQRGTGHAVAAARGALDGRADHLLVFYGDNPFVRGETIRKFAAAHIQSEVVMTLATTTIPDFEGPRKSLEHYGRIVRDDRGRVTGITEYADAPAELRSRREVNTMMYAFRSPWLWDHIGKLSTANVQKEYLITDLVQVAVAEESAIGSVSIPVDECYGINSREELEILEKLN